MDASKMTIPLFIASAAMLMVALAALTLTADRRAPVSSASVAPDVSVIEKLGRHLMIDPGVQPTIAMVQDPDALRQKNPIFYKDAQPGDWVMIWPDKAVLYSASQDFIRQVFQLTLGSNAPNPAEISQNTPVDTTSSAIQASSSAEHPTIEIRNGTRVSGLAKRYAELLSADGFVISRELNAAHVYPTTMISTKTPDAFPETLQKLHVTFGVDPQPMPSSERDVRADILIIIGQDIN